MQIQLRYYFQFISSEFYTMVEICRDDSRWWTQWLHVTSYESRNGIWWAAHNTDNVNSKRRMTGHFFLMFVFGEFNAREKIYLIDWLCRDWPTVCERCAICFVKFGSACSPNTRVCLLVCLFVVVFSFRLQYIYFVCQFDWIANEWQNCYMYEHYPTEID